MYVYGVHMLFKTVYNAEKVFIVSSNTFMCIRYIWFTILVCLKSVCLVTWINAAYYLGDRIERWIGKISNFTMMCQMFISCNPLRGFTWVARQPGSWLNWVETKLTLARCQSVLVDMLSLDWQRTPNHGLIILMPHGSRVSQVSMRRDHNLLPVGLVAHPQVRGST